MKRTVSSVLVCPSSPVPTMGLVPDLCLVLVALALTWSTAMMIFWVVIMSPSICKATEVQLPDTPLIGLSLEPADQPDSPLVDIWQFS